MAYGQCRRRRKKQTCPTAFINVAGSRGASRPFPRKTLPHNFHHRCGNPAALLVRSPGKPCHTTFITVAASRGASRTFSSSTPGPRRRVFSRILRFAPRPKNQAGNQAGNQARLSPLMDSAPSLYTAFGMISCDSAPCPDDGSSQESLTLLQ